jgi:hypothetical protein
MSEDPPATLEIAGAPVQPGEVDSAPVTGADQTQALLRQLRKTKKELETFKQADEQRKTSDLSETEKANKRATEAEAERDRVKAEAKTERLQNRFEAAALKAGVVDPDAAFKLADLSDVEWDENGKPIGLDAIIKDLKAARPFLFAAPAAPKIGTGGGNPAQGNPVNTQGMTASEVRAKMSSLKPGSPEHKKFHSDVAAGRIKIR